MAAVSIAVVAVTLLLASCGVEGTLSAHVTLVPVPAASGRIWRWTVQCPFGPAAPTGCDEAGPILGSAQLTGDGWNLGGSGDTGSLDMSVRSRGVVTIDSGFASTPPCTASTCLAPKAYTWVRGYPSVLYGINQCHARTSPPESPVLPLPMQVGSIAPRLIGVTTYSASAAQVTYDVAYDLWLHDSATKQPCQSNGTLEIMVWTDYAEQALLPAGMQVGTASVPFAVDHFTSAGAGAWSVYASNIEPDGRTAPWGGTLWFVLHQADIVSHGQVGVDLSAVLSAADRLLRSTYAWPSLGRHYWLDTASFGVEFGPASGGPAGSGPSRFSVQISRYCLAVRSTLADAACA
jgi:Glycosyl hydrolase family 12